MEEERLAVVETNIVHINQTLSEMKSEIKELKADTKAGFADVNKRLDELKDSNNAAVVSIEKQRNSDFKWLAGVAVSIASVWLSVVLSVVIYLANRQDKSIEKLSDEVKDLASKVIGKSPEPSVENRPPASKSHTIQSQ